MQGLIYLVSDYGVSFCVFRFCFAHLGQPLPCVLTFITVSHSWSHALHFHQTFLLEPAHISLGLIEFFSKFHSSINSGWVVDKSLIPSTTTWFLQQGQPLPRATRCEMVVCQLYPHFWHFHQTFLLLVQDTSSGGVSFLS